MTDTPSAEVAQQPTKHPLLEALDRMGPEIARALPRHITGDRIARLTLTAIRQNERLLESTPQSFFGALMTSAALGLEPGVNGEAYLVPYRDRKKGVTECQLIVGYQGVAKLFYQHPMAKRIATGYVRERDHFRARLEAIAAGMGNKAIARRLDLSPRTVEVHRANIMRRAGAGSVAELLRLAFTAELARGNPLHFGA